MPGRRINLEEAQFGPFNQNPEMCPKMATAENVKGTNQFQMPNIQKIKVTKKLVLTWHFLSKKWHTNISGLSVESRGSRFQLSKIIFLDPYWTTSMSAR